VEALHRVTDGFAHPLDLTLASFVQRQLDA